MLSPQLLGICSGILMLVGLVAGRLPAFSLRRASIPSKRFATNSGGHFTVILNHSTTAVETAADVLVRQRRVFVDFAVTARGADG